MKINWITPSMILALMTAIICSCSPKTESTDDSAEWPELDSFHIVMAESFHPYRDSSDLAPVKKNAHQMTKLAESWVAAELPAKVDNEETRGLLNQLKDETVTLESLVDINQDDEIGQSLTRLHDVFHSIQEKWYAKKE